jgi:predicted DNA-binding transcriptional regulator YafY
MYQHLTELLSAARLISRAEGATIKDLEIHLHRSRRSVYRILDALEELGYPIYDDYLGKERVIHLNDARENLRWWLPYPKEQLTNEDILLLEYLLQKAETTPAIAKAVNDLKKRLAPLIAEGGHSLNTLSKLQKFQIANTFHKKNNDNTQLVITNVLNAITNHSVSIVSYKAISNNTIKTFRIHPLMLFEKNNAIYVFVFVPYYGHIRILALERIIALKITEETFQEPENFTPDLWLKDPFGFFIDKPFIARIWFSPEQAPYIKELEWTEGCSIEEKSDGSIILSIETAGAYELKRWVMSFGASARLIEPESLQKELLNELEMSIALYKNN